VAGARTLLAAREMRLYMLGQTCSLLGDTTLWLAMSIWVKELTASNSAAALVVFAFMLPRLAAPVAGMLVDALPLRRLLIAVNLGTAAAVLPLLLVGGEHDVWVIYVVAFAAGASGSLLSAGQSRLLTIILPDELLGHGNALFQTIREGLRLIGPLAGAGLFAWLGGGAVAALDAASYLAAALALASMRLVEPDPAPRARWVSELAAGLRYVRARAGLRRLVLAGAVAYLAFGLGESAIFAIVDDGLHEQTPFVGVLLVFQGIGALGAGMLAPAVMARAGEAGACAIGMAVVGIGVVLMAGTSAATVVPGMVLFGVGLSWEVVGTATFVQRSTPRGLQGRVYAVVEVSHAVPLTFAIASGATLLALADYRLILAGMVACQAAGFLWLLSGRELRSRGHERPAALAAAIPADAAVAQVERCGPAWGDRSGA
jgi:MFS family permease